MTYHYSPSDRTAVISHSFAYPDLSSQPSSYPALQRSDDVTFWRSTLAEAFKFDIGVEIPRHVLTRIAISVLSVNSHLQQILSDSLKTLREAAAFSFHDLCGHTHLYVSTYQLAGPQSTGGEVVREST